MDTAIAVTVRHGLRVVVSAVWRVAFPVAVACEDSRRPP
jgi:hypothetical protein